MNIKYNLARKSEKTSLIMVSVHHNGQRLQVSSGKSVEPKQWDIKKGRVKTGYMRQAEINNHLSRLEAYLLDYNAKCEVLGIQITKESIRAKITEFNNPIKNSLKNSFYELYEMWLDSQKNVVKPRTIIRLRTSMNHIWNFEKKTGIRISFDNLSQETITKLFIYLTTEKKLVNNSARTVITNIKTFLNYAVKQKIVLNINYDEVFSEVLKKFKVKAESDSFHLSEKELKRIEELDLSAQPRLEKVRILFLFQCYTGLRFSDLMALKPTNFDIKQGLIKVYTLKTNEVVELSITGRLKRWLNKISDLVLPKLSNQKYNDYLKELAQAAGIDEPFSYTEYHGIERIDMVKPKYELISSHTGRRTFITLSIEKGMMPERVMILSGHKSRSVFEKYVKAAKKEALKQMNEVWE